MSSFQVSDDIPRARLGKTNEQKQAEKDAAAAVQAATERGDELRAIALKKARLET